MADEIKEYYKCPWCNKTVAFKHEGDDNMKVSISKDKPPDKGYRPRLLISRKCERHECRKIFWVEIYKT